MRDSQCYLVPDWFIFVHTAGLRRPTGFEFHTSAWVPGPPVAKPVWRSHTDAGSGSPAIVRKVSSPARWCPRPSCAALGRAGWLRTREEPQAFVQVHVQLNVITVPVAASAAIHAPGTAGMQYVVVPMRL